MHISLTLEAWQTFRGYYNLENSLRTDAAFKEIQDNVIEWGWTYQNQSKTNVNVSKDSQKSTDKKVHHYMVSTVKQTLTILQILFHNLLIRIGITLTELWNC